MFRTVTLLVALAAATLAAQGGAPAVPAGGAGGFDVRPLPGRVGIDGRAWQFTDVQTGQAASYKPSGAEFELRFSDPATEGGVQRWTVTLEKPGSAPLVLTSSGKTRFAYVSRDRRFVFIDPLVAIDVASGQRYDLSTAFGIQPYVTLRATTPDGRSIFGERSACLVDCASRNDESYFEILLPK